MIISSGLFQCLNWLSKDRYLCIIPGLRRKALLDIGYLWAIVNFWSFCLFSGFCFVLFFCSCSQDFLFITSSKQFSYCASGSFLLLLGILNVCCNSFQQIQVCGPLFFSNFSSIGMFLLPCSLQLHVCESPGNLPHRSLVLSSLKINVFILTIFLFVTIFKDVEWVHMWKVRMGGWMGEWPLGQKVSYLLVLEFLGSCELSHVNAGNQIQDLCKRGTGS